MTGPRHGLSIPLPDVTLDRHPALLRRIEELGFSDLWSQETAGCDAFTPLAAAAPSTRRLRLGTAIASVFSRGPALLAMQAAALAELAPGRFVLGIGSSSAAMTSDWNAVAFDRPLARVRDGLRFLRRALAGERIDDRFETFSVTGFALERPPAVAPPIYLAALGPKMRALAAQEADGVILSLVAPEDVVALLGSGGPASVGAPGEVVLRVGVFASADAERARGHCRRLIAAYLNVDVYASLHRGIGRGELLEPMWRAWRAGERRAALDAIPDRLVDALFVHGSPEACREQLARFGEAGVTTVVAGLMAWDGDLLDVLRALAPR